MSQLSEPAGPTGWMQAAEPKESPRCTEPVKPTELIEPAIPIERSSWSNVKAIGTMGPTETAESTEPAQPGDTT